VALDSLSLSFLLFGETGVELRALHLQSRHSTAWPTPLVQVLDSLGGSGERVSVGIILALNILQIK
jgi:hypothetical protein